MNQTRLTYIGVVNTYIYSDKCQFTTRLFILVHVSMLLLERGVLPKVR
jgi:hypothetical protein